MEQHTVEERLAALGRPDGSGSPETGRASGFVDVASTWSRGTRWGRRRRAVVALAATFSVAVLGALGAVVVPTLDPAGQEGAPVTSSGSVPRIPERLWDTPSRSAALTWGVPVVAAQEAPRAQWFGTQTSVAAVTGDGRQGFVEAPDYAGGLAVAPDGGHMAYWVSGQSSGTPNTSDGWGEAIVGVAVRDLLDGTLQLHRFEAPHGVRPETIYWADDTLLVFRAGAYRAGDDGDEMARASSELGEAFLWDVAEERPVGAQERFGRGADLPDGAHSWARDGVVAALGDPEEAAGVEVHPVNFFGLTHGTVSRVGAVEGVLPGGSSGVRPLTFAGGGKVYVVGDLEQGQSPNAIAEVPVDSESEPGRPRVLKGSDGTFGFFGVREGRLLVSAVDPGVQMVTAQSIQDVVVLTIEGDSVTREVMVDVHAEEGSEHGRWQWATGLLESSPLTPGVKPEAPFSPWLWVGAGSAVLLLGLGAAGVWWRRAQP